MRTESYADAQEPHAERARAILRRHPEVRQLIGRNPWTAALALGLVVFQTALAAALGSLSGEYWWLVPLAAYGVGAFANHALYVVIHDATHDLVFRRRALNLALGILADLPNVLPGARGFRHFHLRHHAHFGRYPNDMEMPSQWEVRLVGNRSLMKALWLAFFPLIQALRTTRMRDLRYCDGWLFASFTAALSFGVGVTVLFGWGALAYLILSTLFGLGLHPLGGRWIQEHLTKDGEQDTGSYYGPLNLVALNVGLHNEHHDLPSIPWNRLPRLRQMAPEFYANVTSYPSWTALVLRFIFDPGYALHGRVETSARGVLLAREVEAVRP